MDQLDEIIEAATAAVSSEYFQLKISGGPSVWRERVYCYELYHQMRLQWPEECPFALSGDVDKRAHPIFMERRVRPAIPDLLVHSPGDMSMNLAVIEVKSEQARPAGIQKDLKTLSQFRDEIGYKRAIYLFFGPTLPCTKDQIPDGIELWLHSEVGRPAARLK